MLEPLPGEPASVRLRPSAAAVVDAAVAEQQLRDAVTQTREIGAHLLTRTREVTRRLATRRWDRDRRQRACEQQPHQKLGVLTVALNPIGCRTRRLRRGNDVDAQAGSLGCPIERIARRAGLITAMDRLRQPLQPPHHLLDADAEARPRQLTALTIDRGGVGRASVDIKPYPCHRCGHGRTLPSLHGVSRSQSPARQTPDLQPRGSGLYLARGYSTAIASRTSP